MNEISSVNFQAKHINKVTIQKFDKKAKQFFPIDANFVQLDCNNKYDIVAINKLPKSWKEGKFFQNISTSAHWMDDKNFSYIKVYALTTQMKNLNKLSYSKILGLVEMRKDNDKPKNTILHFLQVKPIAMNNNKTINPKYKSVGTSIIDSLKKIYKSMSLYSDSGVEPFYEKNGFVRDNYGQGHFVWYSNKLKMLMTKLRVAWEDYKLRRAIDKIS